MHSWVYRWPMMDNERAIIFPSDWYHSGKLHRWERPCQFYQNFWKRGFVVETRVWGTKTIEDRGTKICANHLSMFNSFFHFLFFSFFLNGFDSISFFSGNSHPSFSRPLFFFQGLIESQDLTSFLTWSKFHSLLIGLELLCFLHWILCISHQIPFLVNSPIHRS